MIIIMITSRMMLRSDICRNTKDIYENTFVICYKFDNIFTTDAYYFVEEPLYYNFKQFSINLNDFTLENFFFS